MESDGLLVDLPGGGLAAGGWRPGGSRHISSGPGGGAAILNPSVVAVAIVKDVAVATVSRAPS